MNEFSPWDRAPGIHSKTRSMGLKLIVVCGLALLMTIPAFFVGNLIEDRTHRAADVERDISDHVGGQQTFLGPTLIIPWEIPNGSAGTWVVFPAQAEAKVQTLTQERRRSLFKVPVFQADLKLDATFDLTGVPVAIPHGAILDWSRAQVVVGASGPRGALTDALITVNGKTSTMAPLENARGLSFTKETAQGFNLRLFGTILEGGAANKTLNVTSTLRFSGAKRLEVLAYGKTTHLTAQGDWPNPGFGGGFLPVKRTVSEHGFTAEWSVPFLARGVPAEGTGDAIAELASAPLSISFVEMADAYQSVNRSLKYVLLFLGLLFLSYFVFEVTSKKRVHPAQYLLVGIAQLVFYLLLLSLAERTGFDVAFALAGTGTVGLLSANAVWVFHSRAQGVRALGSFSLLYAGIYWLLRLEDNALLVGATASFLVLAAGMYLTRNIDWYGSREPVPSDSTGLPT